MPIKVTGNELIDTATAEIAVALRDAVPGGRDGAYYEAAEIVRDAIMAGTRQLDAPGYLAGQFSADEVEALIQVAGLASAYAWGYDMREAASAKQADLAERAWAIMDRG